MSDKPLDSELNDDGRRGDNSKSGYSEDADNVPRKPIRPPVGASVDEKKDDSTKRSAGDQADLDEMTVKRS
ncbi:MAG: hypothetical protein ACR2OO_02625 [Thermomicrobiales bacterium]